MNPVSYEIFHAERLKAFVRAIFESQGFSEEHALTCAEVLVSADARGIDSHGVARLSGYLRLIEKGRINPKPRMVFQQERKAIAQLNADGAIGLVSAPAAMQRAIEITQELGSGWCGIHNSNHFGIAGYHALMAVEHDFIGMAMTNASPLVSPSGGKERMLGTNPIAVAVPAGEEPPFVLDMATSAAANGKLEIAQRQNKPIPEGWVMNSDGTSSKDPLALKEGGLLLGLGSDADHGYHKGYGLGAWVDIFSGVLNGGSFGPWAPPFVAFLDPVDNQPGKGLGHFVGCWDPAAFRDLQEFKQAMDLWIRRFRQTAPIDPHRPVLVPGDPERTLELERKESGIPIISAVVKDLENISQHCGVSL
jgi:LDH2 family malate/lactate/ureidoglycolate dehydrogenase